MKNKYVLYLMLGLMVFGISKSVYGSLIATSETDMYDFENDLTSDVVGGNDLAQGSAFTYNTSSYMCGGVSFQTDGSGYLTGTGLTYPTSESDFCIMGWMFHPEVVAAGGYDYFYVADATLTQMLALFIADEDAQNGNDNDVGILYRISGANNFGWLDVNGDLPANTWYHMAISYSESNDTYHLYLDGVFTDSVVITGKTLVFPDDPTLRVGSDWGGSQNYQGKIDDLRIFEAEDCNKLNTVYNGGACYETGAPVPPTMTINTDLVNSTINYNYADLNISFNATFTDIAQGVDNATCNLLVNNTFNQSLTNVNLSVNQEFTYTFPIVASGWYGFNISCNATDGSSNDSILNQWYNVDLVNPIFMSDYVNESNYTDNDNFEFYFNATDDNLYYVNLSIFNESGVYLYNRNWSNFASGYFENYTSFTLNGSFQGNNTIWLEAWDSHTTNELLFYPTIKANKLSYKGISFQCNNTLEMDYERTRDSIKPIVTLKEKDNNVYCYYSGGNFVKVKDSKYKDHYVDLENRVWIDELNSNAMVSVLDDGRLFVSYTYSKNVLSIKSESIGDLNYVKVGYNLNVAPQPSSDSLSTVLLTSIDSHLENIEEAISMIAIIILYLGMMALGYALISGGSLISGGILWFLSIGIDFLLTAELYDTYVAQSRNAGIVGNLTAVFLTFLIGWVLAKASAFIMLRQTKNKFLT